MILISLPQTGYGLLTLDPFDTRHCLSYFGTMMDKFPKSVCVSLFLLVHYCAAAFVAPKAFLSQTPRASTRIHTVQPTEIPSTAATGFVSIQIADLPETILKIVGGVTILAVVLGGLILLLANIIVPKAAEQLEAKAKAEYPDLWQECEAQLKPDEVLTMRPDLMQELGNKVQELDMAKFEAMVKSAKESSEKMDDTVDAEVISKNESKD